MAHMRCITCVQVISHYTDYLEAHGKAEVAASALVSHQLDEGFDLEGLPEIAPAEVPLPPSNLKVQTLQRP